MYPPKHRVVRATYHPFNHVAQSAIQLKHVSKVGSNNAPSYGSFAGSRWVWSKSDDPTDLLVIQVKPGHWRPGFDEIYFRQGSRAAAVSMREEAGSTLTLMYGEAVATFR